jgi:hypothetical protein
MEIRLFLYSFPIPLVERTVEIDQITQHPDLESDMRYLMELRKKVTGAGDKKEGR